MRAHQHTHSRARPRPRAYTLDARTGARGRAHSDRKLPGAPGAPGAWQARRAAGGWGGGGGHLGLDGGCAVGGQRQGGWANEDTVHWGAERGPGERGPGEHTRVAGVQSAAAERADGRTSARARARVRVYGGGYCLDGVVEDRMQARHTHNSFIEAGSGSGALRIQVKHTHRTRARPLGEGRGGVEGGGGGAARPSLVASIRMREHLVAEIGRASCRERVSSPV